ncbi:hypothetical protein HCH52_05475 [Oscillospiraceae bacterium HV4-5-C5C]|nr:hypothetical protein [Oscillospiraceae bacterium HV4-5-C5C]
MKQSITDHTSAGFPGIDLHTHILPQMDDGSESLQESLAMLQQLQQQGVGAIALSSHYYPYKEQLTAYLERRQAAWQKLGGALYAGAPRLALSAEVFFCDTLLAQEDVSSLCTTGSDGQFYLLTELPEGRPVSDNTLHKLLHFMDEQGIIPILAHLERYPDLFHDAGKLKQLTRAGIRIQLSTTALAGSFFERRRISRYISQGLIHGLGSDAHNMGVRAPRYAEGYQQLCQLVGRTQAEALNRQAWELISGNLLQASLTDSQAK